MRDRYRLGLFVLLGATAMAGAQPPAAQTPAPSPPSPPPPLRPLWQPEQAWYIRQWQVTGPVVSPADDLPTAAWNPHISWQDEVYLGPPADAPPGAPPGRTLHRFAAATVTSPTEREAALSIGSSTAWRVWLNGELAGQNEGAPAFFHDAVRHPVRLRAGENRLVIELATAGAATFSARLLEPGAALPPRLMIAPAMNQDGNELAILTDAAGPRMTGALHVAAFGVGGRLLGEGDAIIWGETVRLRMDDWPDGPFEVRVSGPDPFGVPVSAWLRGYKGNWQRDALELAADATAAPADPAGAHLRFLSALIADAPGDAYRAWGRCSRMKNCAPGMPCAPTASYGLPGPIWWTAPPSSAAPICPTATIRRGAGRWWRTCTAGIPKTRSWCAGGAWTAATWPRPSATARSG